MRIVKLVLLGLVTVLIAFLAGWLWGNSGKSDLNRAAQTSQLRTELLEARGAVLKARVDLYNLNFGEASSTLEQARGLLTGVATRLKDADRTESATRLDLAISTISEAQGLTNKLDPGANSRAAEAVKAIDEVLRAETSGNN